MSLQTSSRNKEFELVPPGLYVGRCYRIIDGGTQDVEFQGNYSKKQQVRISWEILDDQVKMRDGRPFSISKTYTNSLNEKATLRRDLEAWRGKPFTKEEEKTFYLPKVLGTYCQLQVAHKESGKGNTYAVINAIVIARKPFPAAINENVTWNYDQYSPADFNKLTNFEKEFIKKADEWYDEIEAESEAQKPKLQATPGAAENVSIEDIDEVVDLPGDGSQGAVNAAVGEAADKVTDSKPKSKTKAKRQVKDTFGATNDEDEIDPADIPF